MTQIAKELIEKSFQTQSTTLDLGFCGLDGTEDEIFKLLENANHLQTLILANSWDEATSDGKLIRQKSENYHQAKPNHLKQFPSCLPLHLKKLILSGYSDEDWDMVRWNHHSFVVLTRLSNLTELYLSFTQITDFAFLSDFKQLKSLHLNANGLRDISFLQTLDQLENLHLNDNQISDLSGLKHLNKLKRLHLRKNNLQDLDGLETLSQLIFLDIAANQIPEITLDFLNQFEQLETLILSANPFENLPKKYQGNGYKNALTKVRSYLMEQQETTLTDEPEPIFLGDEDRYWKFFYSIDETEIAFALEMVEGLPEINLRYYLNAYKAVYQYIYNQKIESITIKQIARLNANRQIINNHQAYCPPEISVLKNLNYLEINSKVIQKLPPEIGQLYNLMTLKIPYGALHAVPYELSYLPNFFNLNLEGNQFTTIPDEIICLEHLGIIKARK